jgi:hypothetical protein
MEMQLNQTQWLELPIEVRLRLRSAFGIKQSTATQATLGTFGRVQSDGCSDKDVSAINVDSMQKYLGNYTTDDFFALFTQVLTRISEDNKVEPVVEPTQPEMIYTHWERDLIRMKSESESLDLVLKLKHLVWEIFPQPKKIQPDAQPVQKGPVKGTKKGK